MHAYNAWLPPPVRELVEAGSEKDKFHEVVQQVERHWKLGSAEARSTSLKWISVVNSFLRAKSELATSDVELLVKTGLDILFRSSDNLFIQIRWGQCIAKVLKKYRSCLQLNIEWRPLYQLMYEIHYKRRHNYEGLALKQIHFETVRSLVRCSRRFFPEGSVGQIWHEFRPAFNDLNHNASLEAVGFLSLFLPTTLDKFSENDRAVLSSEWLKDCLNLWSALPNSRNWDCQWVSLVSRYIKHTSTLGRPFNWDLYLPTLMTHALRSFEVPVGKSGTSSPIRRDVNREVAQFISAGGWSVPVSKYFAKSIIYVLRPDGHAHSYLLKLIDLLEQYYHPSNGGSWTSGLERFLHHLVQYFQKRLAYEQRMLLSSNARVDLSQFLGSSDRTSFVKALLPLIERSQYSKDGYLSQTAATTAAMLSYVEPSLVLPFISARFQTALNAITATHQLESAVTTLALAARPTFLACAKEGVFKMQESDDPGSSMYLKEFTETLVVAMFNTLLGMDANDPPKTLATMELYSTILCNVGVLGDVADGGSVALPIDWSQWLDEFLSRLFVLFVHLEPGSRQMDNGLDEGYELASSTFLMEVGSFYHSVIELLFGRLSKPLHRQVLKKLSHFVLNNALPGAASEIGLLCSFAVLTDPPEAISQLLQPLIHSLVSTLNEFPSTGFCGSGAKLFPSKASLSQAVETSVTFQLNILSAAVMFGGANLLQLKDALNRVVTASFNAPSNKVNEAGNRLLSALLGSLVLYYPLDQYKLNSNLEDGVEAWISTKLAPGDDDLPVWHIPSDKEIAYAHELMDEHLRASLDSLQTIFGDIKQAELAGKEYLRVLFLRLDAVLRGLGSCLPDFRTPLSSQAGVVGAKRSLTVAGAFGASIGDTKLREETANTLHQACEYLLRERADDTVLLMMLIRVMDLIGNCATLEYSFWMNGTRLRQTEAKSLTEPKMNFITMPDARSKRRPRWLVIDMVFLHNAWRSSQDNYRPMYPGDEDTAVPGHIKLLTSDLLKLSLHRYDVVRKFSAEALAKNLKRFPPLVKDCLPLLTGILEDPNSIEESAIGACKVLTQRPVLRHLTQDLSSLSTFFRSLLKSEHHESWKAQSAINELFVVFYIRFGGLPGFSSLNKAVDGATYKHLVTYIVELLSSSATIHWRYVLMANGMLLMLMVPPVDEDSAKVSWVLDSRKNVGGLFLSNLKNDLPALRPLSILGLLCLLRASSSKASSMQTFTQALAPRNKGDIAASSLDSTLSPIVSEKNFGVTVIRNFASDHHYPEGQGRMGRFSGMTSARVSDIELTALVPPFARDWPKTRTWDAASVGEAFSSSNAKFFKRLVQECGATVLNALRAPLEEAADSTERAKQCVAAEILAGLLHSDARCVIEAWESWLRPLLRKALTQATVESISEWGACIRFAVTCKGHYGESAPTLQYEILECIAEPLSASSSTSLIAKRLTLLRAALVEFPQVSNASREGLLLAALLKEVAGTMTHPAPQVRENVGSLICIILGDLQEPSQSTRVDASGNNSRSKVGPMKKIVEQGRVKFQPFKEGGERGAVSETGVQNTDASSAKTKQSLLEATNKIRISSTSSSKAVEKDVEMIDTLEEGTTVRHFSNILIEEARISAVRLQSFAGSGAGGAQGPASSSSQDLNISDSQDAKWMETVCHFVVASLKSGKAVDMTDTLVGLLHPVLSLQETPSKELSDLAIKTSRLINWHPFPVAHLSSAVAAVLGAAADSNWHTRVAALVFIQSFVYRHTFLLAQKDLEALWSRVQQLLSDSQVEVRELAATTMAGLMKESETPLAVAFREQALHGASILYNSGNAKRRPIPTTQQPLSQASIHGHILAIAACVLSVPYDMPSWLPDMVLALSRLSREPAPSGTTAKKTIAEFRRTHSDMWAYQKNSFSEEQLEVLSDLTTSASYFA